MIRRFYIMPLNHDADDDAVAELLRVYDACDAFIPGLLDSATGLDGETWTAIWENVFVDEETYSGPYMVHPYHSASLDSVLMADSPELLTHDIYTVRYELPGEIPRIDQGIRRLVLMNLAEGADTSKIEEMAAKQDYMATSVFCADNVGWVSAKGRAWTHIWEQGFSDQDALDRYLETADGIASSSLDGLRRIGVDANGLKIFCYPFALKPRQNPAPAAADDGPAYYAITARTALEDADAYVALLESTYDHYVAGFGGKLVQRLRTVEQGYLEAEIQSIWELPSMASYNEARFGTGSDPRWAQYVLGAGPIVKDGTRRFYRAV